jgi:flavin reductase (DIM6/NTAB) family NADH-FMN oxidoreductase RutF
VQRKDIPVERFQVPVVHAWSKQWLLLASGDFGKKDYNCMTVGWGGFGVMWGRPLAMIVVRPTRHTWLFTEKWDSFTLSAFPEDRREALSYLGSHSGRDGDKIAASGLTPVASRMVASPGFDEAELIVECRKMYFQDLDPSHFLDPSIEESYPKKDYHRMYFGQIVSVSGDPGRWMQREQP